MSEFKIYFKWWERLIIFFIPGIKIENDESITIMKRFRGRYIVTNFDFKIKEVDELPPTKGKE